LISPALPIASDYATCFNHASSHIHQLHIYGLEGKLSCKLKTQGQSDMSFELTEAKLEALDLQITQNAGQTTTGTHISAVGLSLTSTKNNGIVDMNYEGREGATARWHLDGLGEMSRVAG
jgi:DNA-binding transcriptional ArsR family regulator